MNTNQLLHNLKFAINSENHSKAEWMTILKKIESIGQKAHIRRQALDVPFLEILEDKDDKVRISE